MDQKAPEFKVVDSLLETVSFSKPDMIELVPTGDSWSVHLIRHRKSSAYQFKGDFLVTITVVTEYKVNYTKFPEGGILTVNLEKLHENQHVEVEVQLLSVFKIPVIIISDIAVIQTRLRPYCSSAKVA